MTGSTRRAAYVILSHRYPTQIESLVEAIHASSPQARILVWHDARRSAPPVVDRTYAMVHSSCRSADWGSWELVLNTVDAFRLAVRELDPSMLVLVSGQDRPCVNLADWERRFLADGGGWVGEAHPLQYRPAWGRRMGEGDSDLTRYTYRWYRLPWAKTLSRTQRPVLISLRELLFRVGNWCEPLISVRNIARGRGLHVGFRIPTSGSASFFKGSQWLAVSRDLLDSLLLAVDNDQWLRWRYRRTIIPDESYLQTILMRIRPPQTDRALTYVQWSASADAPQILTVRDLHDITASGSIFCRKVESPVSDALMTQLDLLSATVPHSAPQDEADAAAEAPGAGG